MTSVSDWLALGTAQLGMLYGIGNISGQPGPNIVSDIIASVWNRGVRFFDTAQKYGTSEAVLGRSFAELSLSRNARVVTKLSMSPEQYGTESILRSVETSLERLNVPSLWGIMLHQEEELDLWTPSIGQALENVKRAELVSRIGVSVYSPKRALQAIEIDGLDMIQVPANVFDRRMKRAGVFERAQKRKKHVFVRSVYLQGLALMPCDSVPIEIPHAQRAVREFRQFCARYQMDCRQFAIDYVRRMAPNARLVVGAETAAQATENCESYQRLPIDQKISDAWTKRWPQDIEAVTDPRRWPAAARNN